MTAPRYLSGEVSPEQSARMSQNFEAMHDTPPRLATRTAAIIAALVLAFVAGGIATKAISNAAYGAAWEMTE